MKNLQQVREAIAAKIAEAEAIQSLATEEARELTADETSRIDAILGTDANPGELKALREEEARALRLEQLKIEALARQNPASPQGVNGAVKTRVESPSSVRVPAVLNLGRGVMNRREQEEHCYRFGQFCLANMGNKAASDWCSQNGIGIRSAMSEGWDSKGGVLVPEEFEASIIRLVNEYGVARREFENVPMSRETKTQPRRTGGLTAYYLAEAGTITASDPTLDQIRLTAKDLGVLARHSSQLGEDAAVSIGDFLGQEAATAFSLAEDSAAFLGDGTSTYGRIVGLKTALATNAKFTAATGHTAFSTLTLDDFTGMIATVATYGVARGNAKWYISRAGWAASMQRLAEAAGGNVVQNVVNGVPSTMFLGFPVVWVEVMNSTLTAQTSTDGLCYFGDARVSAKFGDRKGMMMDMSPHVYFTTNEIAIRWVERYDINVHDIGTSSGAGGLVMLSTPGS